jgi:Polyketide cyclase / dehydrase and lipid transport
MTMREIHDSADRQVQASPAEVFGLITDLDRLPEWNDAIRSVDEKPPDLTTGAEWLVTMHPNRLMTWQSRSHVDAIDRDARHFAYRTVNADGNPSYAFWTWDVAPLDAVTKVTVSWNVYLETLDRRLLAGPIRRRQLRNEVAASLRAIDHAARTS